MDGLSFEEVCFRYPGQTSLALDHLTVQIPARKRVAIIGRNGSGKSTFFLLCNGILKPESGRILLDGQEIGYGRKAIKALRQKVGIVFQNADDQLFSASIEQDISFGPFNLGLTAEEVRRRVDEVAAQCELQHLLDKPVHALSGGQKPGLPWRAC
jgi:cobalt/nickel transport system ATP-binding protein